MAQAKAKNAQILTTDRGGPLRLALGGVLLAIGLGWAFAMVMSTVSAWNTLRLFRDTANGLAGVLCPLLPVFALAGGAMLCVSARRRISPRAYLLLLAMYLCLLGILTLVTSVSSRGNTLMNYIANNNKNVLGLIDNTSFSAYLTGAYNLRGFNGGQLAGGGLLGMLIAYPVYSVFNTVGGATLLIMLELVLLLVLLRLNPAELITSMSDRRYQRHQQEQELAQQDLPPQTDAYQSAPQPPQQHPVEPLIRPQTVNYTTTSVQSDPEPSYLVPDDAPMMQPEAEPQPDPMMQRGFVPVESGVLYEEHIPVGEPYAQPAAEPARKTRRQRAAEKQTEQMEPATQPAEPSDTPQPAPFGSFFDQSAPAPQPDEQPPDESEDELPWYERSEDIPPIDDTQVEQQRIPAASMKPVPIPMSASTVSGGRHVSGEVKQVYTDPAVKLTGERIPITPRNENAPKQDPFAQKHTAEAIRAVTGKYAFPPLTLMQEPKRQLTDTSAEDNGRAQLLEHTLASFNIEARVEYVVHGPAITRFALRLADGVNVNRLNTISNNLAMTMKAVGLRIEIPIPGTSLVGIEVPNQKVSMVTLKEVLDSPAMRANPSPTAVAIGKDITGTPIICELSDMPHMLIAGATGSGKSVCINAIIQSILYRATPQQVRMIMIDPKLVELQPYNGIPHLLTEVVSDPKKAAAALDWLVQEMGDRYRKFQQAGVRNIAGYNKKMTNDNDKMPDIVAIIDEFSDLMVQCRKSVEESIQRLAALARAAGIYMIVATQRPSVDVITGVIKANIPSRIAFAVANNVDSRTIIDSVGAEKLLGKGDMLYFPRSEFRPLRVQGCFVSDNEVSEITDYIKEHNDALYDDRIDEHMERVTAEEEKAANSKNGHADEPEFQADTENELLQRAIAMAVESGQMSISMLRRRLGLGHSRAGKLIDTMANMGIVSQDEGPKPRRTLITREDYLKMQSQIMDE